MDMDGKFGEYEWELKRITDAQGSAWCILLSGPHPLGRDLDKEVITGFDNKPDIDMIEGAIDFFLNDY